MMHYVLNTFPLNMLRFGFDLLFGVVTLLSVIRLFLRVKKEKNSSQSDWRKLLIHVAILRSLAA